MSLAGTVGVTVGGGDKVSVSRTVMTVVAIAAGVRVRGWHGMS
jgi:hypothetical protein